MQWRSQGGHMPTNLMLCPTKNFFQVKFENSNHHIIQANNNYILSSNIRTQIIHNTHQLIWSQIVACLIKNFECVF